LTSITSSWSVPTPFRGVMDVLRRNRRPIRDALVIVGIARGLFYYSAQGRHPWNYLGVDAAAYHGVDLVHPYAAGVVGDLSAYLYSPAFALALAPFSALPFDVFYGLWALASFLVLGWLVRPWPWALGIFFFPITAELMTGQVHLFIAAAIVLGFRRPGLWALPILTKITPGIGLLWFAVRREWRALAEAVGVTLAIVAVSFVLYPTAWFDWFDFLRANSGSSEAFLLPRIAIGAGLVAVGALTDRRWLVPVAVWFTLPHIWASSWVILLAVIRLHPATDPELRATTDARDDRPTTGGHDHQVVASGEAAR
jgi:hypothetical protein